VETLAAFFAGLLFIAVYSVLAPWWRYSIGRSIVALDTAITLVLLPGVLHILFGVNNLAGHFWTWFALVTFGSVPLIILWRLVIFVCIQRKGGSLQ